MSGPDDGWEVVSDPKLAAAAASAGADKGPVTLTGDTFLSTLDPAQASQVKALAEGRMNLPNGMAMRSPVGQKLLADTAQYDPTFDVANAPARTAARKAFTSGKQGQNITSFNTAIGHLGTLAQNSEKLANGNFPIWNGIANAAESATGDPRVTNFNVAKQAVVDELERAFKGTGGNVHEIKQWEETLNSSRSPAQLRGAISQAADLLNSRIGAMRDSYNSAMGTTDKPLPMLNEHASDALSQFQSPDFLSKGYGAIAVHPGLSAPPPDDPTDGGGSVPTAPLGTPPAAPAAAPAAEQPTLSADGSSDFVSSRGKQLTAEAQQLLANPKSTRADFDALAQRYGAPAFGPDLDAAIQYRAKTGKIAQIVPAAEHRDATIGGAIANSVVGSAVNEGANTALFGTLPKIVGGINAVKDRLSGDNRSLGDVYANDYADAKARLGASEDAHPIAAALGGAAGFIGADGALSAIPGVAKLAGRIPGTLRPIVGDALTGAGFGVGSSDSLADVPEAALKGGALAAAGGVLGRGVIKGAAALASPVVGGAVRRLTDAGVTLTPGQVLGGIGGKLGGFAKGVEDRLAGFPGVGDLVRGTRRGGVEDFNKAAINDALKPIGETSAGVGHAGIADMQQKASAAIDQALTPIKAMPDAQLAADVQGAGKRVTDTLSKDGRDAYDRAIDEHVEPYLRGNSITGDGIKSIKQGLDGEIGNLRGQGSSPQDRKLADHLEDVRESFLDFADRADPSAASDYANARQAYAMSKRVEAAAAKSKDGVFTPNQFRQAVTKRGYGTTTANVARGSAPMQQLATDASTILPSSVPDSGTAGRAALGLALGGGTLGAGEGYREGGGAGALTGALVGGALLSRPGARGFQYLAAGSRGKTLNTLGAVLRRNAALGGAVGAPALLTHRSQ